MNSILLATVAGFGIYGSACNCAREGTGSALSIRDDLFPTEWQHREATLTIGGVSLDTEIELESEGAKRVIKILKDGILIENEVYEVDSRGIRLLRIGPSAGDRFEPPVELIKFPSRIGEVIEWKGRVFSGSSQGVLADAVIVSRAETVSLAAGPAQAVHVTVELKLRDGSETPATRRLQFWFVRGDGPVKRDFGTDQVREPRTPRDKAAEPNKSSDEAKDSR